MPFRRRRGRDPDLGRVQRWLEKSGILDDIREVERRFKRRESIGADSIKAPDPAVATLNVLIRQGLRWPSERGVLIGKSYNPLLVRADLRNIRAILRAQLEEIREKSHRLEFLRDVKNLAEEELKAQLKDLRKIEREGTEAEKAYHARVVNLLRGIADTCERMQRLLSLR